MASFGLEFEQGSEVQRTSFESESISIGRDRSSDFILDHPTVSRQHALIVHQGNGMFQLVVLSRGGLTAVDGTPVESTEVTIYDGSEITLGKYTVRFRSHQAPPKPASAGADEAAGGAAGMGGESPEQKEADEEPEEEKKEGPQIKSWDEIAASSEEDENEGQEGDVDAQMSNFQRIKEASSENDDESNPAIIIGGLAGAALLLFFVLSGGGSGGSGVQQEAATFEEQEPVKISVSCIDPSACRQEAEHNYERGINLIEQRAIETGNLFEGYTRLLEARAYLEEAGIEEIPDEMDRWQEMHDEARQSLDARFQELRVRYHQANQRNQHREMVNILNEIEAYFPERSARENEWARDRETEMKNEGIYPRR